MARPGPASQAKRARERAKQEKRKAKEEKRASRKEQKALKSAERRSADYDPDLAGIVPGPQPTIID
jgi:hypothetical protein